MHQPGVPVVQPAREAEGHGEGRVGVGDDVSEAVVVDSFDHCACGIRHHAQGSNLIVGQIITRSAPGHGDRHSYVGVLKPHEKVVRAVEHRQQGGPAGPEVFLDGRPVDLLGDSSAQGIVALILLNV